MSWEQDIEEWSENNDRDPTKVEKICIRHGWRPEKYLPEMKSDLNYWLDQWYTLSIKTLPQPATNFRRNPGNMLCQICYQNVVPIRRLFDGQLLVSCGDAIHDKFCECEECS